MVNDWLTRITATTPERTQKRVLIVSISMDVRPIQPFPFNRTGCGPDHVFSYRVHGPRTANCRKAILMAKGHFRLTLGCWGAVSSLRGATQFGGGDLPLYPSHGRYVSYSGCLREREKSGSVAPNSGFTTSRASATCSKRKSATFWKTIWVSGARWTSIAGFRSPN